MMSLLGFGSAGPEVDILLKDAERRALVDVKIDKDKKEKFPLYSDGESVSGKVVLRLKDGRRIEHNGVKIEFIGRIEFENSQPSEFLCMIQELAVPGDLQYSTTFDFEFRNVEKQYESYFGNIVKLRYFLRVKVLKKMVDIVKEKDIWVYSFRPPPEANSAIKMEVGIEQSLHIEFEYNKSRYNLKDIIVGKIYFLLVRIKIKHMELSIIRRETCGTAKAHQNDQSTITTFEIMDGAPVKGETIPIRLFLSGFELTPTFRDVNKKFSVRYYLNLVLVDEERRRYYKQQEITLLRKSVDMENGHQRSRSQNDEPLSNGSSTGDLRGLKELPAVIIDSEKTPITNQEKLSPAAQAIKEMQGSMSNVDLEDKSLPPQEVLEQTPHNDEPQHDSSKNLDPSSSVLFDSPWAN